MNWTEIVEDCNWWAGTNDTTYPLTDKARNANKALRQIGRRIMRSMYGETFLDDNNTDFTVEYTDLVSGEDNIRLELGMFTIERVRVKDRNGTFQTLEHVSRRDLTDEELNESGDPKKFYRTGQTIRFSYAPDYSSTGGVEVEYQQSLAQEFTATGNDTYVPGFNEDYHPLVGLYMARDYNAIHDRDRYVACEEEIQRIETGMDTDFQRRNRSKQPVLSRKRSSHHIIL